MLKSPPCLKVQKTVLSLAATEEDVSLASRKVSVWQGVAQVVSSQEGAVPGPGSVPAVNRVRRSVSVHAGCAGPVPTAFQTS